MKEIWNKSKLSEKIYNENIYQGNLSMIFKKEIAIDCYLNGINDLKIFCGIIWGNELLLSNNNNKSKNKNEKFGYNIFIDEMFYIYLINPINCEKINNLNNKTYDLVLL